MMAEAVVIPRTLTCIGMRTLKGGKTGQAWLDEDDQEFIWTKAIPGVSVGARWIWNFANTEMTRAYTKVGTLVGPSYVDVLTRDQEPRIAQWEAEHYAAKTLAAKRAQAKKDQTSDLIEALRPYKEAYRQLAFPDARAAYLATIIRAITG